MSLSNTISIHIIEYLSQVKNIPSLTPFVVVCYRGFIKVRIIDDEEYEKNEVFYVELGEPRLVKTVSGKYKNDLSYLSYYYYWVLCVSHKRNKTVSCELR